MVNPNAHGGVLIRGASGELWFLRDDWDAPRKVEQKELMQRMSVYTKESDEPVGSDLPDDILELLNELFGPLIGIWWVWGPRLAR